jgi:hypothetical protein
MMKNVVVWVATAAILSTATANAQSISEPVATPVTVTVTPLRDAADRAVIRLASTPMEKKPAAPPLPTRRCVKGLAIGAGLGAAVGFASAVLLLTSSGGSDSAIDIMKGFALYGGTSGLMIGGLACK